MAWSQKSWNGSVKENCACQLWRHQLYAKHLWQILLKVSQYTSLRRILSCCLLQKSMKNECCLNISHENIELLHETLNNNRWPNSGRSEDLLPNNAVYAVASYRAHRSCEFKLYLTTECTGRTVHHLSYWGQALLMSGKGYEWLLHLVKQKASSAKILSIGKV